MSELDELRQWFAENGELTEGQFWSYWPAAVVPELRTKCCAIETHLKAQHTQSPGLTHIEEQIPDWCEGLEMKSGLHLEVRFWIVHRFDETGQLSSITFDRRICGGGHPS